MKTLKREVKRVYPSCCTSAHCGRLSCDGCPNLPVLQEFKDWVKETGAKCVDRIWSPNVYRAVISVEVQTGVSWD